MNKIVSYSIFFILLATTMFIYDEYKSSGSNNTNKQAGNKSAISSEYKPGIEYTYFSDGSCTPRATKVCVDIKQAEYLCKNISGYTKYLEDSFQGHYSERVRTIFKAGSVGGYETTWNGRICASKKSASGIYNGTSTKIIMNGDITTFIIEGGKILGHSGLFNE